MKGDKMRKYFKIFCLFVLYPMLFSSGITCVSTGDKAPEMDPGFCMECHQRVSPGLFQSWVESKHAQKGVHCMTCHTDHQAASQQKSMVFPEKCGECHSKPLEDFKKSRHSVSWDRMRI